MYGNSFCPILCVMFLFKTDLSVQGTIDFNIADKNERY